ncbi:DolP-mannose mannosyltransferase [Haloarcula salina]|uniref:DolP-mannose mannosyltransferase n=1 Tax=Haloarcula salina TaxID=1429914 RepID=UPI003C6F60C9
MAPDAAIFEHIGWYLTQGGRLYVDAWEPKLPLSYETTGVLAVLSGGDMYRLHLLSVLLMIAAVCAIVGLVVIHVHDLTGNEVAAAIAGLSLFLLPGFAVRPAYGYKAKYMVVLCGLLAVYLYTREYPALGGAAAAASVGYWQAGAVFPLILVGLAVQQRNRQGLVRVVAGGLAFTVAMVVPVIVLWGSASQMVVQAVLVPLTTHEQTPLLTRIVAGIVHFKWASPFVLAGGYGLARLAWEQVTGADGDVGRSAWWIPLGAAWFAFLVFFVDFETGGYTDLIPGLAFVAIGVGLVAARLGDLRLRWSLGGVLAAVLVVNVAMLGSVGLVFTPVETPGPVPMSDLETDDYTQDRAGLEPRPDVRYVYWNKIRPSTCHYRLSMMELQWLDQIGSTPGDRCVDLATARSTLARG